MIEKRPTMAETNKKKGREQGKHKGTLMPRIFLSFCTAFVPSTVPCISINPSDLLFQSYIPAHIGHSTRMPRMGQKPRPKALRALIK